MSLLASGGYWKSLASSACSYVISISAPVVTWLSPLWVSVYLSLSPYTVTNHCIEGPL